MFVSKVFAETKAEISNYGERCRFMFKGELFAMI